MVDIFVTKKRNYHWWLRIIHVCGAIHALCICTFLPSYMKLRYCTVTVWMRLLNCFIWHAQFISFLSLEPHIRFLLLSFLTIYVHHPQFFISNSMCDLNILKDDSNSENVCIYSSKISKSEPLLALLGNSFILKMLLQLA